MKKNKFEAPNNSFKPMLLITTSHYLHGYLFEAKPSICIQSTDQAVAAAVFKSDKLSGEDDTLQHANVALGNLVYTELSQPVPLTRSIQHIIVVYIDCL